MFIKMEEYLSACVKGQNQDYTEFVGAISKLKQHFSISKGVVKITDDPSVFVPSI